MTQESVQEGIAARRFISGAGKLFIALVVIVRVQQWMFGIPENLQPWHAFLAAGLVMGIWALVGWSGHPVAGARSAKVARVSPNSGVVGMALTNLEGRLLTTNRTFQEMLGYSEEEIRGRVFTEFSPPGEEVYSQDRFSALVQGKCDHYEIDKPYCRKDGQVVWGHLTVSCVRDARGAPQFAVGIVEPIAESEIAGEPFRRSGGVCV